MNKTLQFLKKVFKIRSDGIDIYWFNYDRRRVVGHSGRPQIGDVFTSKMQSGRIAVFEVTNVDWCSDPKNMYFADVKDVGYWLVDEDVVKVSTVLEALQGVHSHHPCRTLYDDKNYKYCSVCELTRKLKS